MSLLLYVLCISLIEIIIFHEIPTLWNPLTISFQGKDTERKVQLKQDEWGNVDPLFTFSWQCLFISFSLFPVGLALSLMSVLIRSDSTNLDCQMKRWGLIVLLGLFCKSERFKDCSISSPCTYYTYNVHVDCIAHRITIGCWSLFNIFLGNISWHIYTNIMFY